MDLTNQSSWSLVASYANYSERGGNPYSPILPLNLVVSSPIVSVKVSTSRFRSNWFTGAWASLWGNLTGEEERLCPSHRCRLNTKDLIQFPDFGIVPYRLTLEFPDWLYSVDVSTWEYIDQSGRYLTNSVEKALDDLNAKIIGENIVFSSVNYAELRDGTTTLQQSTFTATTQYDRYDVGRFYRTDTGEELAERSLVIHPGRIEASFVGNEQIPPGVVSVSVKPLS